MPEIGLPEFSYPNGKPLSVRVLDWLFGVRDTPR